MYCRLQSSEEAFLRYRIYVSILYMGQLVSPLIDNAIDLGNMPVCHLLHSVCQCLLLIARDFAVSLQSANLPVLRKKGRKSCSPSSVLVASILIDILALLNDSFRFLELVSAGLVQVLDLAEVTAKAVCTRQANANRGTLRKRAAAS